MCVNAKGISNYWKKLWIFNAYSMSKFKKLYQLIRESIPVLLKSVAGSLPWNPI
jgi:hypothetical protein